MKQSLTGVEEINHGSRAMSKSAVRLKWAGWLCYAGALFVISLLMKGEYKASLVYAAAMGCWLVGAILIQWSRAVEKK